MRWWGAGCVYPSVFPLNTGIPQRWQRQEIQLPSWLFSRFLSHHWHLRVLSESLPSTGFYSTFITHISKFSLLACHRFNQNMFPVTCGFYQGSSMIPKTHVGVCVCKLEGLQRAPLVVAFCVKANKHAVSNICHLPDRSRFTHSEGGRNALTCTYITGWWETHACYGRLAWFLVNNNVYRVWKWFD